MTILTLADKTATPSELDMLHYNVQETLRDYREAFAKYNNLQMYHETGSTIVDIAHSEMEHFRSLYLNARVEYERAYGNIDAYRDAYSRVSEWSIQSGIFPAIKPLSDEESRRYF